MAMFSRSSSKAYPAFKRGPVSATDTSIKVCVRVRPFSRREVEQGDRCCVSMSTRTEIELEDADGMRVFSFDRTYWSFESASTDYASQVTLMDELGNEQLENVLNGYNACLFAYGQTGSGKTFSVLGSTSPPEMRGLLPRICEGLFVEIEERKAEATFTCIVSYLEIYNEQLRDLLRPPKKPAVELSIHQNPTIGIYVQGLTDNPVFSYSEVQELLHFGTKARTTGSTCMNAESSRSHCIFSIEVKQTRVNEQGTNTNIRCRINLVDLAGSERQTKTQAVGTQLKEGASINQSLSNLAMVISKLAQMSDPKHKTKSSDFVPFRNSKLTYVLQDSLSGNSKTALISAVSPAADNYNETLSTLRFSESVKCIKTKARKNEESDGKFVDSLRQELEALKQQIAQGKGGEDKLEGMQSLISKYGSNYEEQLRQAKENEEARSSALADMGLTVGEVAACVGMDKCTPQLVNTSAAPFLHVNLVNFLRCQARTRVGSANDSGLVLKGLGIMETTAIIENKDNLQITLEKVSGRVLVNGYEIAEPTMLRHGDRLVFGFSHSFRIVIPGATEDLEHRNWERAHIETVLEEAFSEGDPRFNLSYMYMQELEARIGATRAQLFIQQLQKATKMVDEANAITEQVRRLDRLVFKVQVIDTVDAEELSQPECVVRLMKGEVGKARWKNVTKRHLIRTSMLTKAMSGLVVEGTIGIPPPFLTVAIFCLRAFRQRLVKIRKAHVAFKTGQQCSFPDLSEDPWGVGRSWRPSCTSSQQLGPAFSSKANDQQTRVKELEQQNTALQAELARLNAVLCTSQPAMANVGALASGTVVATTVGSPMIAAPGSGVVRHFSPQRVISRGITVATPPMPPPATIVRPVGAPQFPGGGIPTTTMNFMPGPRQAPALPTAMSTPTLPVTRTPTPLAIHQVAPYPQPVTWQATTEQPTFDQMAQVKSTGGSEEATRLATQLLSSLQDIKHDLRMHSSYVKQLRDAVDDAAGGV